MAPQLMATNGPSARRWPVDGVRHQLLAGAVLAQHQHRGIGRSDTAHQREHAPDRRRTRPPACGSARGPTGRSWLSSMARTWSARRRITRRSSSSIGFAYQSTAPRRIAVSAFSRLSLAVIITTLVCGWRSTTSSSSASPSVETGPPGVRLTSSVTTLGCSSRSSRRASSAVAAVRISYSSASPQRSWFRIDSSSSTMRIFSMLSSLRAPGPRARPPATTR